MGRRCHFYTTVNAFGFGRPGLFLVSPVQFFTGQATRVHGPAHPAARLTIVDSKNRGKTSIWTLGSCNHIFVQSATARTTNLGLQQHSGVTRASTTFIFGTILHLGTVTHRTHTVVNTRCATYQCNTSCVHNIQTLSKSFAPLQPSRGELCSDNDSFLFSHLSSRCWTLLLFNCTPPPVDLRPPDWHMFR